MDDEELGRIMSTLTTAIIDARNQAAEMGIDAKFHAIVKHARAMHEILQQAMREAPELVGDHLHAYRIATGSEIRTLKQFRGKPASWSVH